MEFQDNHKLDIHSKEVHTRTVVLIECNKCNTSFGSREEFDNHSYTVHSTKSICTTCEYEPTDKADLDSHIKTHKVKCRKCEHEALNLNDLDEHMEETHGKRSNLIKSCEIEEKSEETIKDHEKTHMNPNLKCNKCEFRTNVLEDLNQHILSTHINVVVEVNKLPPILSCSVCDHKFNLNIQLKKHMDRKHTDEGKYQCNFCEFNTDVLTRMYQHKHSDHPELKIGFTPKKVTRNEYVLNFLAEQNKELMEELVNVKKELVKLSDKTNLFCTEAKEAIENLNHKIENTEKAYTPRQPIQKSFTTKTTSSHTSPSHTIPLETERMKTRKKSAFMSKPKILYVGDSIGHNINFAKVEKETKTRIRTERAFSSVHDTKARGPSNNFARITPQALKDTREDDPFSHLILSAPSDDISNLDAKNSSTEDLQHEIITSCQNMFAIAEGALKTYPELKKVTIIKHAPRFDQTHDDPRGLKPELAKFANATFDQLWFTSPYKERVQIGNHILEVENGFLGIEELTRNIIHIINNKKIEPNQNDSHLHCPQAEYQRIQKRKYSEVVR